MSLRGHVGSVYQVAWSADSRLLVSGSSDSTLKVWDVKTGKLNMDLPGHADEVSEGKAPHHHSCVLVATYCLTVLFHVRLGFCSGLESWWTKSGQRWERQMSQNVSERPRSHLYPFSQLKGQKYTQKLKDVSSQTADIAPFFSLYTYWPSP